MGIHIIDVLIFIFYMLGMLGIGYYFMRKNTGAEDYYVGGRNISSGHIGLSVVATDVGGGFSIGLGGLGFTMGLSGSWMLFTGLLGAWLSAVFLIPKVKALEKTKTLYTFPEIFGHFYSPKVAILAGLISGVGYIGFTASQILAGAKLASATVVELNETHALILMGIIVVVYTVMGGIKAVIYSDTIQWAILMLGLICIGIPLAVVELGGLETIRANVKPEFLRLDNIAWTDFVNWGITIIPIWFVGMTLYQRIYACNSERTAKRAWFIAGIFEYPIMAFMGVALGLLSRVAVDAGMFEYAGYATIEGLDPEKGLPLLLRTVLPVGLLGIMLSAYFSAIMSTADSCLMAASGNFVTDLIGKLKKFKSERQMLRFSQLMTLVLGIFALLLASQMQNVLELMLYSYAFMVSGLFVPLVSAFYWKKSTPTGALAGMIVGGGTTLILILGDWALPLGLDANFFGILASLLAFQIGSRLTY
jgi:SSS family solute:Na+ symporter